MSRGQTIQWPNALHPPPDNSPLDAQYQHLLTPRPQAEIKKPTPDSNSNGTTKGISTQSSNTTNNISPSDRINGSLSSGQSNSNSSSLKQTIGPGNISLNNLPPPAPVDVPIDLGLLGANSSWQTVGATNSLSFGSKNSTVKDVDQLEQTAFKNGMLSMNGAGFQVGKIAATAFGAIAGITLLVCIIVAITRSCKSRRREYHHG